MTVTSVQAANILTITSCCHQIFPLAPICISLTTSHTVTLTQFCLFLMWPWPNPVSFSCYLDPMLSLSPVTFTQCCLLLMWPSSNVVSFSCDLHPMLSPHVTFTQSCLLLWPLPNVVSSCDLHPMLSPSHVTLTQCCILLMWPWPNPVSRQQILNFLIIWLCSVCTYVNLRISYTHT